VDRLLAHGLPDVDRPVLAFTITSEKIGAKWLEPKDDCAQIAHGFVLPGSTNDSAEEMILCLFVLS
jgi:hypothetical protein